MELLFPLLLIAVFYFLLIRPQQRQRKQMAQMQQQLGIGSQVMTGAGLIGTVAGIDEENDQIILEVAPGVTNTYVRRSIVNVLSSPDDESLDDTDDDDGELTDDIDIDDRDDIDRALDEIEANDQANESTGSSNSNRKRGDDAQ